MEEWKENGGGGGKRKVEGEKEWKVKGRGREMEKGRERKKGGRGIIKGNGKGKEDSLRNVGCTDARTNARTLRLFYTVSNVMHCIGQTMKKTL